MQTFSWSTGVLVFHHRIVKFPNNYYKNRENTEWRRKTENKCLVGKTSTKRRNKEKEMVVLSEKGKRISIKTEVASSSMKPFEKWPVEHEEEASKRNLKSLAPILKQNMKKWIWKKEVRVRKLTKEELEMYQQYKEFYTIQGRTKGKIPSFSYIHWLKVEEHYPGVPSDVAEMLSHPIEGEVQDIDCITEQEIIEIWMKTCYGAMKMS